MVRRKRRNREEQPPATGVGADPNVSDQTSLGVGAILIGPADEVRDRLATLLSTWTEIRLVGVYQGFSEAFAAMKESGRQSAKALLVDARLPPPNEARSVIRSVRAWFPAMRILVYGDELDETTIESLYFAGADAVVRGLDGPEDITAIVEEERVVIGEPEPEVPAEDEQALPEVPAPPEPEEEVVPQPERPEELAPRGLTRLRRGARSADRARRGQGEPERPDHEDEEVVRNLERLVAHLRPSERAGEDAEQGAPGDPGTETERET